MQMPIREEERGLKRFGCKGDVGGPQGNATTGPHPTLVPGAFLHPAAPALRFSLCTLLSPSPALRGLFPACLPACLPPSNLTRSRPFLQICSIHWPWCTSPLDARSHSGPRGEPRLPHRLRAGATCALFALELQSRLLPPPTPLRWMSRVAGPEPLGRSREAGGPGAAGGAPGSSEREGSARRTRGNSRAASPEPGAQVALLRG